MPSPLDMPKKRVTLDMLGTRLAWTTVTGDAPLPPKKVSLKKEPKSA